MKKPNPGTIRPIRPRIKLKGIILDDRGYIAVKCQHYFRKCEGCDVGRDGLCGEGTLGAKLCNAFAMHYQMPVRFRYSRKVTDAISTLN